MRVKKYLFLCKFVRLFVHGKRDTKDKTLEVKSALQLFSMLMLNNAFHII